MINLLKFINIINKFRTELLNNTIKMKKIVYSIHKSRMIYKMNPDKYHKIMSKGVSKFYKKGSNDIKISLWKIKIVLNIKSS